MVLDHGARLATIRSAALRVEGAFSSAWLKICRLEVIRVLKPLPGLIWFLPRSRRSDDMADPEAVYHWHRLDDRVTTSGQPTESQLSDIHALGVRHVINLGLHTHEKALPDEAASVSRLGMTYIHIPVDFQNPTDRDFEQFCAVMEELKEVPVHVHCIANYRVSAFFYRYRRDLLGMDEAMARAKMEEIWHPEGVWAAFVGR